MPKTIKTGNRFQIRIHDETCADFIRENAKENGRTITQEINYLIQIGRQEVIKDRELMERVKAGNTQISSALKNLMEKQGEKK